MVKRHKRSAEFSVFRRSEILDRVGDTRSYLCRLHAEVKPFSDDYRRISQLVAVIDHLAAEWTGQCDYFHEKGHGG